MREHEQNMIRLENSLTLNKLRQQQILEQKLANRRAVKMQELEQEQLTAVKVVVVESAFWCREYSLR